MNACMHTIIIFIIKIIELSIYMYIYVCIYVYRTCNLEKKNCVSYAGIIFWPI